VSAKFEFIDAQKAQYPIIKMCAWLDVSTSGFYEWRGRPASATARRRERLATLIGWIFDDSDQTYGHRRIHAALTRQGEHCSPELVREIMRDLGLVPCQPRPFRPATTVAGDTPPAPDLLGRDFRADAPGAKLVGDITYIPTWEGWLYLASVIDCCTKECIGYALADHMRADLVIDALAMAARNHTLAPGAIFHSDRGTQYVPSTLVRRSCRPPPSSTSADPWVAPVRVSITRRRSRSTRRSRWNESTAPSIRHANTPGQMWPGTLSSAIIRSVCTRRSAIEPLKRPTTST
jgi:transposase InsO family protein